MPPLLRQCCLLLAMALAVMSENVPSGHFWTIVPFDSGSPYGYSISIAPSCSKGAYCGNSTYYYNTNCAGSIQYNGPTSNGTKHQFTEYMNAYNGGGGETCTDSITEEIWFDEKDGNWKVQWTGYDVLVMSRIPFLYPPGTGHGFGAKYIANFGANTLNVTLSSFCTGLFVCGDFRWYGGANVCRGKVDWNGVRDGAFWRFTMSTVTGTCPFSTAMYMELQELADYNNKAYQITLYGHQFARVATTGAKKVF
eukprot:TRINITY_DN12534_c0_g1_i1.p1 TRINITY_DN12534_c0_g1~~TRINITY_DN12534_c0_g1_i1.p1  ORF type:complete len:252 (+),score=15.61 TRINITY_DN12534_c0_g1_i1:30-785(+)